MRGLKAVGIDLLDDQIDAGRRRFPSADLRLVDEGPLPFPDGSFDTVVLKESLHHLAAEGDINAAMNEIVRVGCKRLIVFEPNPCVPLKVGRTLIGHVDPTCPPAMARSILEHSGFTITHLQYSDTLAFPLSGGYVSKPLAGGPTIDRLDALLLRALGRRVAWRYLLVGDI